MGRAPRDGLGDFAGEGEQQQDERALGGVQRLRRAAGVTGCLERPLDARARRRARASRRSARGRTARSRRGSPPTARARGRGRGRPSCRASGRAGTSGPRPRRSPRRARRGVTNSPARLDICARSPRAHEVDELHDQQLELVRVAAERLVARPWCGRRSRDDRRPTRRSGAGSRARACPGGRRCRRRSRCARRSSARARGPCRRRTRSCAATARRPRCTCAPCSASTSRVCSTGLGLTLVQRALVLPVVEVEHPEARRARRGCGRASRATASRPTSPAASVAAPGSSSARSPT